MCINRVGCVPFFNVEESINVGIIAVEIYYAFRRLELAHFRKEDQVSWIVTEKVKYRDEIGGSAIASRIYFAFRGRVSSLLGLPSCGVSPISYFPLESPYIRDAR
jgi:hypothetical protein